MPRVATLSAVMVAAVLITAGCSSSDDTAETGACPTDPIEVVVTVGQWSDLVEQLAGDCAEVTTIITGADADPHDFEPSPRDSAAFTGADLVVLNGLGYDHWAEDALATLDSDPVVVDAGEIAGRTEGDNPHVWYDPATVQEMAPAVTTALKDLAGDASSYFDERAAAWSTQLQPYLDEIASVRGSAGGATYAATETVFDDMASALDLVDSTPTGYRQASTNESEPSPAAINDFQRGLRSGEVAVLVVNTQTEGSVPAQLRSVAEDASVPIVEVTETQPSAAGSFVTWQVTQLQALAEALRG
ncbi:MAG TPA: zinc ABC transporter substrate-binding protein [Acidimicrobiales bacterium]